MRGRGAMRLIGSLVMGLLMSPGVVCAEREGSGTHEEMREGSGMHGEMREGSGSHTHDHAHAMPFHEGEQVTLRGRIEGTWLVVTEGPHTDRKFELGENRTLKQLQRQATAGAIYDVSGQILEQEGHNRIVLDSYRLAGTETAPSASPSYREGS